jgi:uncharacterized membrane protein YuzA (DUF378 family)
VIATATADAGGHANGVSVPVPAQPLANGTYEIEVCTPPPSPPFNCVPGPSPGTHAVVVVNPAPPHAPPPPPPKPPVPAVVASPSPSPSPSPAPSAGASPSPPAAVLASPSPAPNPTPLASPSPSLPSYDPASEPVKTANLAVAAFTVLSLGGVGGLAAAGAAGGVLGAATRDGGEPGPDRPEHREAGEATEGKLADDEIIHSNLARDAVARGDTSWTWRAPGRGLFDSLSSALPVSLAAGSPLMARVTSDGSYLEAIFGSASILALLAGLVLGLVAVNDVGGHAVPPSLPLTLALLVLGALNAEAGLVGVATFIVGVLVLGGINSASAVRTIFGLAALWFVIPIVASAARPLRRLPSENLEQRWDRAADFAIASLVGAFAVQQIILGFPGLSGTKLPIAQYANLCAVVVLGALAVRWFAETLAVNLYPRRLSTVHPHHIPEPPTWQLLGGALLRTAGLAFIAVAFVGPRWQLAVGAGLYLLPQLLGVWEERFPNIPSIYRILPRGLVKLVLILVVAKGLKTIAFSVDTGPRDAIADAFVLMLIPVAVLGILDLFGREGEGSKLGWWQRIAGLGILVIGIWFALVVGT